MIEIGVGYGIANSAFRPRGSIEVEREIIVEGVTKTFETVKFPWRNAANQDEAIGGISFDITERKQTEENLGQNESLLEEARQLANIASWNWDIATDTIIWSDEH